VIKNLKRRSISDEVNSSQIMIIVNNAQKMQAFYATVLLDLLHI